MVYLALIAEKFTWPFSDGYAGPPKHPNATTVLGPTRASIPLSQAETHAPKLQGNWYVDRSAVSQALLTGLAAKTVPLLVPI